MATLTGAHRRTPAEKELISGRRLQMLRTANATETGHLSRAEMCDEGHQHIQSRVAVNMSMIKRFDPE